MLILSLQITKDTSRVDLWELLVRRLANVSSSSTVDDFSQLMGNPGPLMWKLAILVNLTHKAPRLTKVWSIEESGGDLHLTLLDCFGRPMEVLCSTSRPSQRPASTKGTHGSSTHSSHS